METREYIESGILELYVYGLLTDAENEEVTRMARSHKEVNDEIISIEKAIVDLSTSFSPFISAETFERIREKLALKHEAKVVQMKSRTTNWAAYLGWAAAVMFLLGVGYLYKELDERNIRVANIEQEKVKLQESVVDLEIKNKSNESVLGLIRDNNNTIVALAGQAVSPESYAKIYWNKQTQSVYVDAAGLPEPPQGMVYQVWSIKQLDPLTPVSIGLLDNFTADNQRIFAATATPYAEAFGITLEPAGGSATPTMEQLYTFGKV